MSFFVHGTAARRYAAARPFFHPVVRDRMTHRFAGLIPFDRALDVACGTGQSSAILSGLATKVVGIDRSEEMLAHGTASKKVRLVQSAAETLPFRDGTFDLVTVALAFHWFEQDEFLAEAGRVLGPGGWLVIYNNVFSGRMEQNPAFQDWIGASYLTRYPTPPRNRTRLTRDRARQHGFEIVAHETYTNAVEFTREELVAYLMTQSNVIAATEEGAESLESVNDWLTGALEPLLHGDRATFHFGGSITFLQCSS